MPMAVGVQPQLSRVAQHSTQRTAMPHAVGGRRPESTCMATGAPSEALTGATSSGSSGCTAAATPAGGGSKRSRHNPAGFSLAQPPGLAPADFQLPWSVRDSEGSADAACCGGAAPPEACGPRQLLRCGVNETCEQGAAVRKLLGGVVRGFLGRLPAQSVRTGCELLLWQASRILQSFREAAGPDQACPFAEV